MPETKRPVMRVVEHPGVMAGHCLLVGPSGALLYVGPLTDLDHLLTDGVTWFLHRRDFLELEEWYESRVPKATAEAPSTLQ